MAIYKVLLTTDRWCYHLHNSFTTVNANLAGKCQRCYGVASGNLLLSPLATCWHAASNRLPIVTAGCESVCVGLVTSIYTGCSLSTARHQLIGQWRTVVYQLSFLFRPTTYCPAAASQPITHMPRCLCHCPVQIHLFLALTSPLPQPLPLSTLPSIFLALSP